ncbi:hypothetical protein Adt_11854 [Abeliophyllum distichum]|uniref:Uncharacterized protein n=1 Tax=Abeliophyllum distichum TaxID=126358 RepID=A0ABD1UP16_9LAMI
MIYDCSKSGAHRRSAIAQIRRISVVRQMICDCAKLGTRQRSHRSGAPPADLHLAYISGAPEICARAVLVNYQMICVSSDPRLDQRVRRSSAGSTHSSAGSGQICTLALDPRAATAYRSGQMCARPAYRSHRICVAVVEWWYFLPMKSSFVHGGMLGLRPWCFSDG